MTYLEEFSSFPLDDGGAPVWILGRYQDVPRAIAGGHDHYLYAFNAAYMYAAARARNFDVPEEAARFIAAANGIAAPQYRTVHHFFDHEHNIGWREGVRTAHEVAASLVAVVESLHRSLPSTWEYDEDTGRARWATTVLEQVEAIVDVVEAWALGIREADLIEAIQDESLRAVHAANGAGFPPAREPSQLKCFWGRTAGPGTDALAEGETRPDGDDVKVPEKWMNVFQASKQSAITGLPIADANTSMISDMVDLSNAGRPQPGYLDLIVDRDRREVRRVGYEGVLVKLSGDADWQTFIAAYDAGERGATESEWQSGYPESAKWKERRKRKAAVQEKLSSILDVAFEAGELKLIPLNVS